MQSPQPLQASRSSRTGTSPVPGWISVPTEMQFLGQASMQGPQPLQNGGKRKGFGFSASWGMDPLLYEDGGRDERLVRSAGRGAGRHHSAQESTIKSEKQIKMSSYLFLCF